MNELFSEMMSHLVMEEMVVLQRLHTLIDPETDRYPARQHWSRQLAIAGFNRVSRDIKIAGADSSAPKTLRPAPTLKLANSCYKQLQSPTEST